MTHAGELLSGVPDLRSVRVDCFDLVAPESNKCSLLFLDFVSFFFVVFLLGWVRERRVTICQTHVVSESIQLRQAMHHHSLICVLK